MIKKYKIEIIIFLSALFLYFVLGVILSYYLNTAKFWNVLFDLDTPRVLGDLTLREYNHYRTAVHPLFVITFQPFVYILGYLLKSSVLSIILIQSVMASLTLVIFYLFLGKMGINNKFKISLTILFGLSFGQIVFASSVETYIYAQFLLMPLWFFVIYKLDKKFAFMDYILLTLLGIGSLAVTITNFIQFLIAVLFLIIFNKKIDKKFLVALSVVGCVISISVTLAELQNIYWPSAPNFFTKGLTDLIIGTSEEKLYISKSFGLKNILNVLNTNFAYLFNIANLYFPSEAYLAFKNTIFINIASFLMGLLFVALNLVFIIKTKFNINKHKLYYALAASYLFNFILHLFYGNSIAFMYICHYNFLIYFLIAYIFNYFKIDFTKYKFYLLSIISVFIILSIKNIISMFYILIPLYNPIGYFRIFPFFFIVLISSLLTIFIFKNKYIKIGLIVCLILTSYWSWDFINQKNDECSFNCENFKIYFDSLDQYKRQLLEMKNEFNVNHYSERETPIGIYFFGMADRPKLLYKEGKLINIKTKEIVKSIDYVEELIVPNEYTVLLTDEDNNNYLIFENENGIYISKNNEIETIFEGGKDLELPEFDDYKYSEILKVNHQEILFNIDGDIPKPNLITYQGAWYRDTMLVAKVLEKTSNIKLLENWVKTINSIYDYQRASDLEEPDNLGELLYILGATNVKRNDLIEKIKIEIDRIKLPDNSISGSVDGYIQKYYPTVLVLHGAEKLGININLTVPTFDDGYAKLTWYMRNQTIPFYATVDSRWYPYLNWAFLHYDNYSGKPYVLDEIYPLSYEGGIGSGGTTRVESECFISEYYCEQMLFLSHSWHASEMFLFLEELKGGKFV